MRVLHVFDHSLPLQSGYSFRSAGIVRAQLGFGWETVLATSPRHNAWTGPAEPADGLDFHRTPPPPRWLAAWPMLREAAEMQALYGRLRELIADARPDIVHAHSPLLTGWPAWAAARRAGLPFVYEVRGLWEDAATDLGRARQGGARYRASRAAETKLLRSADAAVTICEGLRAEIAERGISSERLFVVPNAVSPERVTPPLAPPAKGGEVVRSGGSSPPHLAGLGRRADQRRREGSALRQTLGLRDRLVLGFIGSFYHYEGLDLLLEAVQRLRPARPKIAVLLVGGGPEEARLRVQAAEPGLTGAVRFAGRVPHAEAARYYDLIDLLVLPRRRMRLTELVTPLKPLEAMAAGRLVLASDVGGHRELIADNRTGFLFPADDADALARRLVEALDAADLHAPVRAAARHFVERERTWPTVAATYRAAYAAAAARVPASRLAPRFSST